jgi:hypothetical protein
LKAFAISSIPNGGVQSIGGPNSAEVFGERRRNDLPMSAAIGRQQNGAYPADDPAHLIG